MSEDVERIYTINLGKALISQSQHRATRAINMIKEFARHHMKVETIKIEEDLAHEIWARGARSPPRKIRVIMTKVVDEGHILVSRYTDDLDAPAANTAEETTAEDSTEETTAEDSTEETTAEDSTEETAAEDSTEETTAEDSTEETAAPEDEPAKTEETAAPEDEPAKTEETAAPEDESSKTNETTK